MLVDRVRRGDLTQAKVRFAALLGDPGAQLIVACEFHEFNDPQVVFDLHRVCRGSRVTFGSWLTALRHFSIWPAEKGSGCESSWVLFAAAIASAYARHPGGLLGDTKAVRGKRAVLKAANLHWCERAEESKNSWNEVAWDGPVIQNGCYPSLPEHEAQNRYAITLNAECVGKELIKSAVSAKLLPWVLEGTRG